MKQHIQAVNEVIEKRQSIFPKDYVDRLIDESIIKQILENANRAPSHKLTEPWRFKVLRGDAKSRFGEFLQKKYKQIMDSEKAFLQKKYESLKLKAQQAACIILVCMQRDEAERIPEWEEVAAVACAIQNMYLTCAAYEIGCYWSSPKLMQYFDEFIPFSSGEKCLGVFYMGYCEKELPKTKRKLVELKTEWIDS